MKENIQPATGRLGVLVVGVGGAVATTMITGTLAARKGLAKPIGSIAQMATMRMQNGEEKQIRDIVPLADLNDIVFGGWDIFPDNAYEAAMYAEVLKEKDLNLVKEELHDRFVGEACKALREKFGREAGVYDVVISDGARRVK